MILTSLTVTASKNNNKCFSILSLNIEPIHVKFSEIETFLEKLNQINFKFSIICLQESWLSDNDDLSHLQIEEYQCITQGKTCPTRGGG